MGARLRRHGKQPLEVQVDGCRDWWFCGSKWLVIACNSLQLLIFKVFFGPRDVCNLKIIGGLFPGCSGFVTPPKRASFERIILSSKSFGVSQVAMVAPSGFQLD